MMKKLLKIVLTLILSVSLVGCSSNSSETDGSSNSSETDAVLEILDYWYEYDEDDEYIYYYVAVKNSNENQTYASPTLLVTIYDASNNELDAFSDPLGDGIAAGDTIYYSSLYSFNQDFDSMTVEIEEPLEFVSGYSDDAYPLSTDFDIVSTVEDNSITGTITNNGEYAVDTYWVTAIFKKDGKVVAASLDCPDAYGDDQCEFDISTYVDYDSYEVYCYAFTLMED